MSKYISVPQPFIEIDSAKCSGCGSCVTICGAEVFDLREGKAVAGRLEDCLECGNCEVVCTADAVRLRIPAGGTGIIYECG